MIGVARTFKGLSYLGVLVLTGYSVVQNAEYALVGLIAFSCATFLLLSPGASILAAVVLAFTSPALVALGMPSVLVFADIPLAWVALAGALLNRSHAPTSGRRVVAALWGLLGVAFLSAIVNGTELIRPILFVALIGQPLALIAALILSPVSMRMGRALLVTITLLLAIQIPFAAFQIATQGLADPVQGTLIGAGAGAHVISAICVVGAVWLLARADIGRWKYALAVGLMAMPFAADAKQVLFAAPALAVGMRIRSRPLAGLLRLGVPAASLAALLLWVPAGGAAIASFNAALRGQTAKVVVAQTIWGKMVRQPGTIAVGLGPATSVTRSAFMTTDFLLAQDSPLRELDLRPAETAEEIQARVLQYSSSLSSFNSGISSGLGVFGDIGLLGLAAYLLGWLAVLLALRDRDEPVADALVGAWFMFLLLGLVFDWWEQPPFSVFLSVLIGVVLGRTRGARDPQVPSASYGTSSGDFSDTVRREQADAR